MHRRCHRDRCKARMCSRMIHGPDVTARQRRRWRRSTWDRDGSHGVADVCGILCGWCRAAQDRVRCVARGPTMTVSPPVTLWVHIRRTPMQLQRMLVWETRRPGMRVRCRPCARLSRVEQRTVHDTCRSPHHHNLYRPELAKQTSARTNAAQLVSALHSDVHSPTSSGEKFSAYGTTGEIMPRHRAGVRARPMHPHHASPGQGQPLSGSCNLYGPLHSWTASWI